MLPHLPLTCLPAALVAVFTCNRAAELKYGTLMELQKQLKAAEAALGARAGGQRMLKEEVTEADIAEIISKWTGAWGCVSREIKVLAQLGCVFVLAILISRHC
jgi:hypothetical protein